jgi:hypothetical protein
MVVVSSLEKPLMALASVPRRPGVILQLPTIAVATLSDSDAGEEAPPIVDSAARQDEVNGTLVSIPAATVSIEPPQAAAIHRDEPVTTAPLSAVPLPAVPLAAVASAPEPQAPLASVLLAPAIHSPAARRAPVSLDSPREVSGFGVDIGLGAARIGVVTGDVAARAGTSIGRFFKNGGLAIASGILAE